MVALMLRMFQKSRLLPKLAKTLARLAAVMTCFLNTFLVSFLVSVLLIVFSSMHAQADDPSPADVAQIERLRTVVGGQLQILAAGLLDELVYEWTQTPPFENDTNIVVASVSVPIGLGTGMTAFLENHLYTLLLRNGRTRIKPVHCPACTTSVVKATPGRTILALGVEQPEVLAHLGAGSQVRHALFLDFEAEGTSLLLRAKITSLSAELPVVYARALSTSTSSASLLQDPAALKSPAEARKEYLSLLAGRDRFVFPFRFVTRLYSTPTSPGQFVGSVPPYVWLEGGIEAFFTQAQQWSAGINVGYTSLDRAHDGWSVGSRFARLVSGEARSFVRPDVYMFGGVTLINIKGVDTVAFRKTPPSLTDIVNDRLSENPRASFAAWKIGAEARMKNRFSAGFFAESLPAMGKTSGLGTYGDLGPVSIHCLGLEVGLWF